MTPKVFDDFGSIIHFVAGLIGGLNPYFALPVISILFILYQLSEKEDLESKIYDFVEFALGVLAGTFLNLAYIV